MNMYGNVRSMGMNGYVWICMDICIDVLLDEM